MKKAMDWFFGSLAENKANNPNNIFRGVVAIIALLTIFILVLLLSYLPCNTLTGSLTFLLVAGACFAGGSAVGFLFGFPRSEKYKYNKNSSADQEGTNSYSDNTNLEEVSDWLTKIIVGLTLIKLKTIIGWIDLSAHSIATTYVCDCKDNCSNFYVFGYCIIIFYFLAGAGLFYVWARTNLSIIFTRSKEAQLIADKKELITQVQALANTSSSRPENGIEVDKIIQVFPDKADTSSLEIPDPQFKNKVESIYNTRPVIYKDDLQKERWGGKALRSDRILEAVYNGGNIMSMTGLYSVKLKVRSVNPDNPMTGEVAFFLHDTFPSEIEYAIVSNNLAEINIIAWEAFVVGAMLQDGTELELDLNTVKGFPEGFYWK